QRAAGDGTFRTMDDVHLETERSQLALDIDAGTRPYRRFNDDNLSVTAHFGDSVDGPVDIAEVAPVILVRRGYGHEIDIGTFQFCRCPEPFLFDDLRNEFGQPCLIERASALVDDGNLSGIQVNAGYLIPGASNQAGD